jgi:formimidoylglutamate deiminase
MSDFFFDTALLEGGWAHDVRISVSSGGSIVSVTEDASPRGAERHAGIAVPGVPNVHSHAFQRALAGLCERGSPNADTFWSWREKMYAFLEGLTPDDVEAISAQLYVEMLRHGFTAVAEFHYLRNDPRGRPYEDPVEIGRRILGAGEATGIGLTLLPVLYRTSDFGAVGPDEFQRRFTASVEDLVGDVVVLGAAIDDSNARVGLALHSLRAVPPNDLAVAVDAVRGIEASAPIHIHVAEQEREVAACLEWSHARPVEWLLANAPVDEHWCLIHATHVNGPELADIVASRAVVGLCPTTEANLGDGIFPFEEYASARGHWGVGSDAHVSTSPVSELRLLEYAQRLTLRRRNVAAGGSDLSTGRALFDAACSGGAQACGRPLGSLTPGARADLVALDANHPTLAGRYYDQILDAWIFSGEDTPVRDVMVGGRWVVRDGRHPRGEAVARAYRAVAERLVEASPS